MTLQSAWRALLRGAVLGPLATCKELMRFGQALLPGGFAGTFLLLAITASGACGCGSQRPDGQTEDAAPAMVFVPCPGAEEPSPTGLVGADLVREAAAGSIEVTVTFCNPLIPEPPDELLFFVTLTDHFGLAPSDLTRGTSVAAGADLRADGPITWDGDDLTVDDHHAKGHLHVPNRTADGTPLLGPETSYLEITLAGIGGDGSIVARWGQEYLPR